MSDIEDYNSDSDNSTSTSSSSEKLPIQKLNIKINSVEEEEPLEEVDIEEEEEFVDDDVEEDDDDLEEDDDPEEDEDEDLIMEGGAGEKKEKKNVVKKDNKVKIAPVQNLVYNSEDEDEDEDDENDNYLQKFDNDLNNNYIVNFHPECSIHNYDEISIFTHVVRDNNNNIIDDLHKTIPFLTKYEKARILGQRAKQINSGGTPFIKVPENVIDGYIIAELELQQKKIPFIIRRPIPGGGSEYWNIRDLEIITF
jgi:DNA-directed RNA polymerase subunit K/omega